MENEKMKNTVVLYPSPGIGHLISMVELGKRFLLLDQPPLSITIIITNPPFNTGATEPYIRSVSASHPSINFYYLPPISLSLDCSPSPHHETLTFRLQSLSNPLLLEALQTISKTTTVRALVMDLFCLYGIDSATQLNIPPFIFFTSPAGTLAFFLYLPTIHRQITASFKDLPETTDLGVPGMPPIPPYTVPKPILDRNDEAYEGFLYMSNHLPKVDGIIINTFDSLEPRALKVIGEGACYLDGPTPPIYTIGPLVTSENRSEKIADAGAECLSWLDSQPPRSVVFLSFGSLGIFSAEQLKEIATGLERSEKRFLWVVRSPPTEDKSRQFLKPPEPDLETLLPEGFLDRTKESGMVVKSWAPQVAVLSKESVGGFVTHCGWNSVLEAVSAGVPMVAWPLYAEQHLNNILLVEEMKLALPLEGADKGRIVSAAEVEKRVRQLMESEDGKALRKRTVMMQECARAALCEGGSSHSNLIHLAQLWMEKHDKREEAVSVTDGKHDRSGEDGKREDKLGPLTHDQILESG